MAVYLRSKKCKVAFSDMSGFGELLCDAEVDTCPKPKNQYCLDKNCFVDDIRLIRE